MASKRQQFPPLPVERSGQVLIFQDAGLRLQVRLDGQTVWLTQLQMADLFQTSPQNITIHIAGIYEEDELAEGATCKEYLQVRFEGTRQVQRTLKHYSLDMILAVGYRVRSLRGTQFRQWATSRLGELLVKGFTLDDERIKAGRTLGEDYFDELLARIRDIRSSERLFYQKITDIYATSIDYDAKAAATQHFFKTVQNKMHWAAHGHTAAEVVRQRADARLPNMGLANWKNAPHGAVRKTDVAVAKNYLQQEELIELNLIVSAYLDFAELQARGKRPMHMRDWIVKLDDFLRLSDRDVLANAGRISHALAESHAHLQFAEYEEQRHQLESQSVSTDFDHTVEQIKKLSAPAPRRPAKGESK